VETAAGAGSSALEITHRWKENGVAKFASRLIPAGTQHLDYNVAATRGAKIENDWLVLECK